MLYYLSLGSNLGKREQTIREALLRIGLLIGNVTRCSSFYYSAPWGFESSNEFCNLCCELHTRMQPLELLAATQAVERSLGRADKYEISDALDGKTERPCKTDAEMTYGRTERYSDRPIDIDIIRAFDDNGKEIRCHISDISDISDTSDISDLFDISDLSDLQNMDMPVFQILKSSLSHKTGVPLLVLPHPLWQLRDFVRIPLAEIMQLPE